MADNTFPILPWLVRLQVRVMTIILTIVLRSDNTANCCLINFLLPRIPPNPTNPIRGLITYDITIDHARTLSFRVFNPQAHLQKLPLIIFFHGGGFFVQTAASPNCHAVASNLSLHLPAIVASLTYRLSPEHKHPSQHQDAHDMLRFLDTHPHTLPPNADLSNTFLAGESAGGNLAHFAAAEFASSRSIFQNINLKGIIAIQPFFGGEERTDSELRLFDGPMIPVKATDRMWKAYLPPGADRDHEACNVSGPNAAEGKKLDGFPMSLVVVGGFDPLQDWQRRYCEWLRLLGKEVELVEFRNGIHGFYLFPELEETKLLYEEVKNFVCKQSDS